MTETVATPKVVAIGGGHGLAVTVKALAHYTGEITAVVSVADDGGSSGRIRAAMPNLPAPGDIRRCLSAMASPESRLGSLLEHRFAGGGWDLGGHAFGNLLLVAMAEELGSFSAAVTEVAKMVGVKGVVLPATTIPVSLIAEISSVSQPWQVVGQVAVQNSQGISNVSIEPLDAPSPEGLTDAILGADQVIIGPGSLFTSVLAAAIVPTIREAVAITKAQRVYVANLHPQIPETAGLNLDDHVDLLSSHGIEVDVVLCHPGACSASGNTAGGVDLHTQNIATDSGMNHDTRLLGEALARLGQERKDGPRASITFDATNNK